MQGAKRVVRNNMPKKKIIGIDVGGVILNFIPYLGTDKHFGGGNYLETPEVPDSIEFVKELYETHDGNVYLVSKHKAGGPNRILEWLHHRDFFNRTGMPESHFYPCKERHEKAPIIKSLGITHFVDDRAEILESIIDIVPNLYWFQALGENKEDYKQVSSNFTFVENWNELMPLIK